MYFVAETITDIDTAIMIKISSFYDLKRIKGNQEAGMVDP